MTIGLNTFFFGRNLFVNALEMIESLMKTAEQMLVNFLLKHYPLDKKQKKWTIAEHEHIADQTRLIPTPFDVKIHWINYVPYILPCWWQDEWAGGIYLNMPKIAQRPVTFYLDASHVCIKKGEHYMSISMKSDASDGEILETRLCGKPGSLFKRCFPLGIDISDFGNRFFIHEKVACSLSNEHRIIEVHEDQVFLGDILPAILKNCLQGNGPLLPFPKNSLEIHLLLNDTFEERVLEMDSRVSIKMKKREKK
jgi:hypothetical protein